MSKDERELLINRVNVWRFSVERFAYEVFEDLITSEVPEFHKGIYKALPNAKFLAVESFRGSAKSTIGLIIYPIWFAIFKKIGDISLLSKSEDFVVNEISRKIKAQFETNPILMAMGLLPTKKWSETYFVLNNGIAFESGGISGQLRGGRRGLIALDDLEDEETAISEDQRNKLRNRINKELIPKLLPDAQLTYFGTPIHTLCYLHQIMQTPDNGWQKLKFACYKDGIEKEGNEMWASMFPHSRLQEMKAIMGTTAFATEMMCNPLASEDLPIKEKYVRYWTKLPDQYSCVITVDPAYSQDENADFKVASVIAIDQAQNRYLLDYVRTHAPTGEFIDSVINLYLRYKGVCTGVGLPKGAGDSEFFTSFMKKVEQRKTYELPITELKNTYTTAAGDKKRNKKARITASLQPLFEQGKYYIHANHLEARDEILTIGQSRWDDIVDTLSYAEQILQPVFFETNQPVGGNWADEELVSHGVTGYE